MWSDAVEDHRNPFDANFKLTGNNQGPRFEQHTTGIFGMAIGTGTGNLGASEPFSGLSFGTITPSRWYHVTALKQTNTVQIYLDGVKKAEETNPGFTTKFGNVVLGRGFIDSPERWFKGKLKNIKIANQAIIPATISPLPTFNFEA